MPPPIITPQRIPIEGPITNPSAQRSIDEYFKNLDINAEKTKRSDNSGLRKTRQLTVKGAQADDEQRRNMETVIAAAKDSKGASERSILAAICTVIVESQVRNKRSGEGTSTGIFQVTSQTAASTNVDPMNIEVCTKYFMEKGFSGHGGAVEIARKNPSMQSGEIAAIVQAPAAQYRDRYQLWLDEAKKWLNAAEGGRIQGGGGTYRKAYQYKRESGENSWDCMQRLAKEVEWRCFPVGRVLYYMSEAELYKRRVAYTLTPDDASVINFTYDIDWREKVPTNEGIITVNLERWGAPPGYVINLNGWGPPDGRWLIISVRRDWFSPIAEVTIRQPVVPFPEPAPDPGTKTPTGGEPTEPGEGGSGIELYRECRHISEGGSGYSQTLNSNGQHGIPLASMHSTSSNYLDCSSSTSLALYRADFWDGQGLARVSGQFNTWGRPGRGKVFTVCYNRGHVYIRFEAGAAVNMKRFDTSTWGGDSNTERGPRLRSSEGPPNDQGYSLRHWPSM